MAKVEISFTIKEKFGGESRGDCYEFCSLVSPHRYLLDGVSEGEHELMIRVDNTNYPTKGGHLTSPDTQTNWNGITGKIELISGIAHLKIFDDKYYSEGNRKAQCLFAAFKLLGYAAGLVCKGY